MTLHVLQLGPYPPPEGGISRNMLAIRDELCGRGDRCSIIATSKSSEVVEQLDVYHPRTAAALTSMIKRLKFDVLHLHIGGEITKRVLALAAACSLLARGKCVLTMHSGAYPLTDEGRNASPNSVRGRIFRQFSRIVAVNDDLADVFVRYGVKQENISVIPPYSLSLPDPAVSIPPKLKEFCERHSPLLLAVGGLEPDYDPLFQIDAMKDILADLPKAGLMIVGGGSMRSEVGAAIAASGYADSISLAGNVDHAMTLHLIDKADMLLRTTLFDGDAISVREAIFLGTPVIATDNGMRPEGVHLINIGDADALISNVKAVFAAGKERHAAKSPDNSNIAAVVNIYRDLAGLL